MVKLLSESAPAKVNLFLRVTGRRSDGYHELDSIFIPVTLADEVRLEMRPSMAREVTLKCNFAGLPSDQRNLAVRAAIEFMREFDLGAQVRIELDKVIPIGAGLAGGSSDAGAVLRMLARLGRVRNTSRLEALALALGADVPYFLNPVPARVGGIGERVTPLPSMAKFAMVLAVPPVEVSTGAVFRELQPMQWSGPASDDAVSAIMAGRFTPTDFVNDLEPVARRRWPIIGKLKSLMLESGAAVASMTGSGGGVFGIFRSADEAERAAGEIRRRRPEAFVMATAPL